MKNLKKLIGFLIAGAMLFSTASAAGPFSIEALLAEQTKDHIAKYYKFGITEEELYKNALNAVLTENPELIETVMEAMLGNLDKYPV